MQDSNHAADDGFVQSLARGIAVLTTFGPGREELTMTQVATACGLTRAGARRILLTLQDLGYVAMDGRLFYVTSHALVLGQGYSTRSFWKQIRPTLQSIADELNETTSAGVLDGYQTVYAVRVRSSRMLQLEIRTGAHLPPHASSMGRTLLAGLSKSELTKYLQQADFVKFTQSTVTDPAVLSKLLDEVRMRGWCYVCGEMDEGISGVSVPLIDPTGKTIAALNVSTSPGRMSESAVEKTMVPILLDAATTIRKQFWPRLPRPLWPHLPTPPIN